MVLLLTILEFFLQAGAIACILQNESLTPAAMKAKLQEM